MRHYFPMGDGVKEGEVLDRGEWFDTMKRLMMEGQHLALMGARGTGKTSAAQSVSSIRWPRWISAA